MGGHPYWYAVDYQEDVAAALEQLRTREFKAGRYNPVIDFPDFPVDARSAAPGAKHASIDEALEAADVDGTRSILDIASISAKPKFGASCELSEDELMDFFETTTPTLEQIQECDALWNSLERGQARHIVVHGPNGPSHLFFAGYSCD